MCVHKAAFFLEALGENPVPGLFQSREAPHPGLLAHLVASSSLSSFGSIVTFPTSDSDSALPSSQDLGLHWVHLAGPG